MQKNANQSVRCSVSNCKFHTQEDFCSLDRIQVGAHNSSSATNSLGSSYQGTDCQSFQPAGSYGQNYAQPYRAQGQDSRSELYY